ncbi:ankyrin repeat domain-containing protein [Solilutibacter silvestris]|uniref:Ankyrin repeats (3 copies) n=1 Tax=Solilutibacter silvestris TaxID=1645665 RepID=A0A2K1Q0L7_9GAMM|nr:ankyrin repeat domain-containing protein [Lysobacter silvestris]PNS08564.1 Ankyrin repeats (3 copies) [Lysobacter silvestris]
MPDQRLAVTGQAAMPWLAAAAGVLALLATGFGGWTAALGGAMGSGLLASAWPLRGNPADRAPRVVTSHVLVWVVAVAIGAVLAAWPLRALMASGSLPAALGLGLAAAIGVVLAWRLWPLWTSDAGDARFAFAHALAERDPARRWAWNGLRPAVAVACVIALILVLAWPGVVNGPVRWAFAVLLAALLPLLRFSARIQKVVSEIQAKPPAPAPAPARNAEPVSLDALPELHLEDEAAADAVVDLPATTGSDELDRELHAAARSGRVERALALLDAGARADAVPDADARDQRRLPILAAVLPDLRLLRALIAQGVSLDADASGITPLLAATRDSWHGRPDAVAMLLANGADVRATDAQGNTPLHHAARSTDPGVAALLLDAQAQVDVGNDIGQTPLAMACAAGNWRLAKFLLERGASVAPANAQAPLLFAATATDDDPAGVQLLLRHRAQLDAVDDEGRSALHLAAQAGHSAIVQTLLDSGAGVDAGDATQTTALMLAAQGGHRDAIDALLEARADVVARNNAGHDALRHAVEGEIADADVVAALLAAGARADAVDNAGIDTLARATQLGRWSVMPALDPAFVPPPPATTEGDVAADETTLDRPPYAVVSDALRDGDNATLERFASLLDRDEFTRMLAELAPASPQVIPWLLARGADVDAMREGHSVLGQLLRLAPADAIAAQALDVLWLRGASPAGAGVFASHLQAMRAHPSEHGESFALRLLERGADPFGNDGAGDPPLHHAIRLHWSQLTQRLLDLGVDPCTVGASGLSALHVATACGDANTVRALVAIGGKPDARAPDGQTALGVALANGRKDLADWLDWRGWPLPGRALRAGDLPAAAITGDGDAVRRLLDLGFPVDALDGQGCSALLRAAGGGHVAAVEQLVAHGANAGLSASTGATPLSAAVSMRHAAVVDRLLAAGADLGQRLPGEVTVLMLASALGLPEMVTRLLRAGADVAAADPQGLAPIHCAALYGFTARDRSRLVALFDTLLLAGADANTRAEAGVTPLLLLLGARAEPGTACDETVILAGLDHLLDEGVELDAQDPRGFAPLHIAALHGLMSVAQRLRDSGAPLGQRDRLNRTPRDIALMRGFVDVAAELAEQAAAPSGADASMARMLRPQDRPY